MKDEIRNAMFVYSWSEDSALRAMLVWEGHDRSPKRSVGRCVCVCFDAYTIRHWGRATRVVDQYTHRGRFVQEEAKTSFEGKWSASPIIEIPRSDTNTERQDEVTVTSERRARAERTK